MTGRRKSLKLIDWIRISAQGCRQLIHRCPDTISGHLFMGNRRKRRDVDSKFRPTSWESRFGEWLFEFHCWEAPFLSAIMYDVFPWKVAFCPGGLLNSPFGRTTRHQVIPSKLWSRSSRKIARKFLKINIRTWSLPVINNNEKTKFVSLAIIPFVWKSVCHYPKVRKNAICSIFFIGRWIGQLGLRASSLSDD